MLLEFSLSNFSSFRQTQTLCLLRNPAYKELPQNQFFDPESLDEDGILRQSLIFGPNASGKSNLIRAAHFMRELVMESAKMQRGDKIPFSPFLLDQKGPSEPGSFQMVFLVDKTIYCYGFRVDQERVWEEWLRAQGPERPRRWKTLFHRHATPTGNEETIVIGRSLKGIMTHWKRETLPNTLFFSLIISRNHQELVPVFDWFADRLLVIHPDAAITPELTGELGLEKEGLDWIMNFLRQADLSIDDLRIELEHQEPRDFHSHRPARVRSRRDPPLLRDKSRSAVENFQIHFAFGHRSEQNGQMVYFPWDWESFGTRKLFSLAGLWRDMLTNDRVLMVDELDQGMHHRLGRFLLGSLGEPGGAQLITTSHDTALLDNKLLRRDQIWFLEKGNNHRSRLYPLSEFQVRRDAPLQRHYLEGRFGASPQLTEIRART